jgi:hypothetical protein
MLERLNEPVIVRAERRCHSEMRRAAAALFLNE